MGSCLILGNEWSEDTRAGKARDFTGKGRPGGEQKDKEPQENCSARRLAGSGFMGMGFASRLSLANRSDSSLSWRRVHCSAKLDASDKDSGRWQDSGQLLLTFPDLLQLVMAC